MVDLTRPIIGVENRTAQEVFDIMCDRFRMSEALSRTGAVKVLDPDMPAQEMRLHMGEMTAQEMRTARAAIRWANTRLSALVPAAPEGQQSVAWRPSGKADHEYRTDYEIGLDNGYAMTRPAEQAVTDEMVDAACEAFGLHERKHGLDHRQAGMRAALNAAMEAGR